MKAAPFGMALSLVCTLTPALAEEPAAEDRREDRTEAAPGRAQWIFGWTAVGAGAAAVVAGAVVGGVAAAKFSDLDCPDNTCPPERAEDVDTYNDLRVPAGLTIAGGLLVAGIGLPFLIYADEDDTAFVRPWVGPGSVGLRGRF